MRRDSAKASDEGKRTISGETCEEVVDAMALTAALAFTEVIEERERAGRENEAHPSEPSVELEEEPSAEPSAEKARPTFERQQSEFLLFARFRGATVFGPTPSFGGDLGVEFDAPFGKRWRWAFRAFVGYARAEGREVVLESVPYGGLLVCPIEYAADRGVLAFCLEPTLARLAASAGAGVAGPLAVSYRPFPTLSAQLRGGIELGLFRFEASVGVETALAEVEYRLVGVSGEPSDRTLLGLEPGPAGVFGVSVGYRIPRSE